MSMSAEVLTLEGLDDIDGVEMYRLELDEDNSWRKYGVTHVDVLEYSEPGDDLELRTVRVSAPAGTWTIGQVVDALAVMQNTLRSRESSYQSETE